MLFHGPVRDEKLREVSVSSFSQADNYAVVMAVDFVSHCQSIMEEFLEE